MFYFKKAFAITGLSSIFAVQNNESYLEKKILIAEVA